MRRRHVLYIAMPRPLWHHGFKLDIYESRHGFVPRSNGSRSGRDSSPVGRITKDMPRWAQNMRQALSKLSHYML